jgi:hypothetical protein
VTIEVRSSADSRGTVRLTASHGFRGMMDGITATRLITTQNPGVAVLGLSCDTRQYVVTAMHQAGAFEVLGVQFRGRQLGV